MISFLLGQRVLLQYVQNGMDNMASVLNLNRLQMNLAYAGGTVPSGFTNSGTMGQVTTKRNIQELEPFYISDIRNNFEMLVSVLYSNSAKIYILTLDIFDHENDAEVRDGQANNHV